MGQGFAGWVELLRNPSHVAIASMGFASRSPWWSFADAVMIRPDFKSGLRRHREIASDVPMLRPSLRSVFASFNALSTITTR